MPAQSTLRVDQLLGNISVKYKNQGYIADEVFPILPVKKDSDKYRVYDRDFRIPETIRSAKGVAKEHSFKVSTSSYILAQHSLKDYVSDRDMENYEPAELRRDATEELTDKLLLRREKDVADLFLTTSSWSQSASLGAALQWSANTTTSNPIPIMDTATTVILENSGHLANYAIVPRRCVLAAKNHKSIADRIKYTSMEITPAMLAALFDIDKLLVPTAVLDSAHEGATVSVAAVWTDNVFVGYRPERASLLKPSAGYIFQNAIPLVKRWRSEERQSEVIEVNMHYQPKVVSSLSGYLIKNVLG